MLCSQWDSIRPVPQHPLQPFPGRRLLKRNMAVFAAQDRKKDGLISAADFKAIMCNLGEKVNARMGECCS